MRNELREFWAFVGEVWAELVWFAGVVWSWTAHWEFWLVAVSCVALFAAVDGEARRKAADAAASALDRFDGDRAKARGWLLDQAAAKRLAADGRAEGHVTAFGNATERGHLASAALMYENAAKRL